MKIRFSYKVLLFIACISCAIWHPQDTSAQHANLLFEHFTMEQGLSAPVTHIAQDKFGFIWLGTTDGLNRFDGNNFIVYRNIPGDSTSLPSNIINGLHVDAKGRIWVATNGGICYYDVTDDQFHSIRFDASHEKLDQYRIHSVCSGNDGSIWFATRTTIHKWNDKQLYKTIPLPYSENLLIKYLHADNYNNIWIGSNEGLHVYMESSGKFIDGKIHSPFSVENNLEVTVHPIESYHKDTLLLGTWYADLQKAYFSGDTVIGMAYPDNSQTDPRRHIVSGIAYGSAFQWWIGTYGNGLSWFDTRTNRFTDHFRHNPSDAKSLSDDYINDVFKDASGIVWIGTNKGLDKFDSLTQQFTSVSVPVPPGHFVVYRIPNTIVEDKNDRDWLWVCVSGAGLYHFNKMTHAFELFRVDHALSDQLPSNNIYSFYYDHNGKIWIGTRKGTYFFDPNTGKFKDTPLKGDRNLKGVHTILQDKENQFWFATNSDGIYKYNEIENTLISYAHDENNPNSIPDNKVFCMLQDYKGRIWIGTQNRGLCSLNPETNEYLFFQHDKSASNSIPDNGVYDLYEDKNHQLWICTENGFASMSLNTYEFRNFTTNDGLCNNTIFSVTPDHQEHLWLGTNNGLSNYDPANEQFRNYYTNDGLPLNRISGEVFFSQDSTLYFGTTGMLSFCHPHLMKMNKRIPSVVITDFSILGKKVPVMRNGDILHPIHLTYKQNMITFNFAALNFSNAFLNQYAYKLDGFDETWIYNGNKQSATYTNLDGGNYTFRVKGANNDGTWNEVGTYALLYVHPPYWKTWWFYVLCTIAIAGILYTFYRIRINQLIRLQNIRTRIARDLHDDIGSTLSSINMISSMADRSRTSESKSAELFHTISNASGQAMDLMSDIVWSINPKNDHMEMIIIRMRQYASEILEAANISFTLEIEDEHKDILLPLEVRKDFYLIFKEAINNLAKYSKAKHVTIRLNFNNQLIHLSIEDNGIGFDPSEITSGNGLKNMKARAGQLKGEIAIQSKEGQGTRVDLTIPLTP